METTNNMDKLNIENNYPVNVQMLLLYVYLDTELLETGTNDYWFTMKTKYFDKYIQWNIDVWRSFDNEMQRRWYVF